MTDPDIFLFVSHVSEDRAVAREIVGALERRGVRCWIAPRDVRPGRPYDDEIVEAIEASRAILLIFSERCNESDYIRREVTVAGESRKLIIPFRIADVQPRRGLRVRLSDLHWIDGFVSRDRAIDQVIGTIGDTQVPVQPTSTERETGRRPWSRIPRSRRSLVLAVAAITAVVLIAVVARQVFYASPDLPAVTNGRAPGQLIAAPAQLLAPLVTPPSGSGGETNRLVPRLPVPLVSPPPGPDPHSGR